MEAKAVTRYIRIAPRKMRLVIDTIRRKPVGEALSILASFKKKGARLAEKTLKSAQANAIQKKMDADRLYVLAVHADGGPQLKRYMPRSMGRADVILKRMTHLTVVLGERAVVNVSKDKATVQPKEKKEKPKSGEGSRKKKPALQAGASA